MKITLNKTIKVNEFKIVNRDYAYETRAFCNFSLTAEWPPVAFRSRSLKFDIIVQRFPIRLVVNLRTAEGAQYSFTVSRRSCA